MEFWVAGRESRCEFFINETPSFEWLRSFGKQVPQQKRTVVPHGAQIGCPPRRFARRSSVRLSGKRKEQGSLP
jgi:hypothetical protein